MSKHLATFPLITGNLVTIPFANITKIIGSARSETYMVFIATDPEGGRISEATYTSLYARWCAWMDEFAVGMVTNTKLIESAVVILSKMETLVEGTESLQSSTLGATNRAIKDMVSLTNHAVSSTITALEASAKSVQTVGVTHLKLATEATRESRTALKDEVADVVTVLRDLKSASRTILDAYNSALMTNTSDAI